MGLSQTPETAFRKVGVGWATAGCDSDAWGSADAASAEAGAAVVGSTRQSIGRKPMDSKPTQSFSREAAAAVSTMKFVLK